MTPFRSCVRVILAVGALACLSGFTTSAANWFVNPAAHGANTGRDWNNAWTNLSQIGWPAVSGGDTLFLAGGSYPEGLEFKKSGSSNAPITVRLGAETGANSPVLLGGIEIGPQQWITINGALQDSFAAPTNLLGLRTITNNIGIYCRNPDGPGIYLTNPNGIKLHWVGVAEARSGSRKIAAHGIWANVNRRGPTDFNEIKYCWINHVENDGIAWIGNAPATHFGHQEVSFSIIENVGDDGLEANHGFSVHDCILGPSLFLNGHPDGIQSVGSFWRIYNNEFHDFFNSWLRLQATQTNHHDLWVYNNLFLSGRYVDPKISLYNTGIELVQYADGLGELESMTWSRIVVCNNTFFGAHRLAGGVINWAKRDEGTKAAFVHNVTVTNSLFVNNLVVECARGASAWRQELKTAAPWGRAVFYADEPSLRWDYNVVAGSQAPEARRLGYFGRLHASGEIMARASVWKHNVSTPAKFLNLAEWNFELAPNDIAARDTGASLNEYFGHDILNRPRSGTSSGRV